MGFMNSYKRLDNLCRDMNGIGVTGYIEDMEHTATGEYYVPGWKKDYLQLKHYRYIRNQIAHENYATEDNMCSDEDEAWLENFHKRIMVQSDPLALHYKATKPQAAKSQAAKPRPVDKTSAPTMPTIQSAQYIPSNSDTHKPEQKSYGFAIAVLLTIAIIVALVLFISF